MRKVSTSSTFSNAYEAIGTFASAQLEGQVKKNISTYSYRDIDHCNDIRILRVLANKRNDDLRCMLLTSALPRPDGNPPRSTSPIRPYWALSYCWGNDEPTYPVEMWEFNEETQRRVFKGYFYIRENLAAALRYCRQEQKDVDIWVDALCINQEVSGEKGREEKSAQVSSMDEVYSQAENVCIWLGSGQDEEESDEIQATFFFLRSLLDMKQPQNFANTNNNTDRQASNIENWKRVITLMQNPWFGRRWVVQELLLAKTATIHWGSEKMFWSDFAEAISLFTSMYDHIAETLGLRDSGSRRTVQLQDPRDFGVYALVDATTNLVRKSEDGKTNFRFENLEILVSSTFLRFETTDPRDAIYAVLSLAKDTAAKLRPKRRESWWESPQRGFLTKLIYGLFSLVLTGLLWLAGPLVQLKQPEGANQSIDPRISPNYDKGLMEVCADFMEYCIEKSGSLDIICRHWMPGPTQPDKRKDLEIGKKKAESKQFEVENLPSWILLTTGYTYGDSFVGSSNRHGRQHYNACDGLRAWFDFEKRKPIVKKKNKRIMVYKLPENDSLSAPPRVNKFTGCLRVRGLEIGTIDNLSVRVAMGIIPKEALEYGGFYWTPSTEQNFPSDIPDQLWRTLVGDRGPEGSNTPAWYRRACLECLALVGPDGDLDTEVLKGFSQTSKPMKEFLTRVQKVVWRRKFFSGTGRRGKNLFGIVPNNTRTGDIICILFGCSVPVVLRNIDGKEGVFNLVGECYVDGQMVGEEIQLSNSRPKYPYKEADEFAIV